VRTALAVSILGFLSAITHPWLGAPPGTECVELPVCEALGHAGLVFVGDVVEFGSIEQEVTPGTDLPPAIRHALE